MIAQRDATVIAKCTESGRRIDEGEEGGIPAAVIAVFVAERPQHAIRRFKPPDESSTLAESRYFAERCARSAISLDDARPVWLIASRYSETPSRPTIAAARSAERRKRKGIFLDRGENNVDSTKKNISRLCPFLPYKLITV